MASSRRVDRFTPSFARACIRVIISWEIRVRFRLKTGGTTSSLHYRFEPSLSGIRSRIPSFSMGGGGEKKKEKKREVFPLYTRAGYHGRAKGLNTGLHGTRCKSFDSRRAC